MTDKRRRLSIKEIRIKLHKFENELRKHRGKSRLTDKYLSKITYMQMFYRLIPINKDVLNGYKPFLLFYYPKHVQPTGEVIFNTHLKKMNVNTKNAENLFTKSIKLLNSDCSNKSCEWCKGV